MSESGGKEPRNKGMGVPRSSSVLSVLVCPKQSKGGGGGGCVCVCGRGKNCPHPVGFNWGGESGGNNNNKFGITNGAMVGCLPPPLD